MAERKHEWQNQHQFLQDRYGPDKDSSLPENIAVGLPFEDAQAFDLLCWTINMAARPGDSVVALRQRDFGDVMQKVAASCADNAQLIGERFKPLQNLCDAKQVHLEIRSARVDVTEKILIEEILAMNATMLVVTTSGHNLKRHAHRRGNFLCRQVPIGCSIVVVKDYKILCYKDNKFRSGLVQKGPSSLEEVTSSNFQTTPIVARGFESPSQFDTSAVFGVWSPKSSRTYSPQRVLDSSDAFYDSCGSPSSSDHSGLSLSRSLFKKPLMSCASSSHCEEDNVLIKVRYSCLGSWRGEHQAHQTYTFIPGCRFKRCKALKIAFKFYMNSLRIAWPLKVGSTRTPISPGKSWKVLSYDQILKATSSFNSGNLVGKGGYSEVYKGRLGEGQLVAVKRMIRDDTEEQRTIDFLTEIGMVCHAVHPNIMPLVGYCIEKGLHLIYNFVRHGNLAAWLYGGKLPTLKWAVRYKVAAGVARGLNYLHSDCQRRIIHRDIKASNILLGPDFEPQISDFGLAKWLPDQCSHHVLSPIEGTFGYLAPEYVMNGIVDEKTDVFAFGVLLLELITGRKAIEGVQYSLVMWARPLLETMNADKLVDVHVDGNYDPQEMQCMMMAAALCVQQSPQCRPCMGQVLQLLTDEHSSDGLDSNSVVSSQSLGFQDAFFDGDYSSTHYQDDLRRHREIALEF